MLPQGQHGSSLVSEEMAVVSNPGPSLNFSSVCAPAIVLSMMRQASQVVRITDETNLLSL